MTTFSQMQEAAASRRSAQRRDRSEEYKAQCKKASSKIGKKALISLQNRQRDYEQMVAGSGHERRGYEGYHRPGSVNLRKG